ncbi:uncharacterized protein DUF4062 [Flavobacterium sp. 9]|uniref:DUF4062 domain-containing protein n=1 Tax=Flavobacterium sp. 9 TaxID=2035198 RepID=UPI000C180451|nr:DUF4062 domain-containing protein [Flavobacterium sp. 9]PIF34358.1 uncharacterized protein DUF4062 [Flavobacterium sp. 9]
MAKQKVYISSTFKDLQGFRAVLIDFFDKQGKNHFEKLELMEHMYDKGDSKPFLNTCLEQVMASDIYIIILGKNAGSFPPDDIEKTYTMHEYITALKAGKTIFRFVYSEFKEQECDNLEKYNELRNLFNGIDVHQFLDIKDFRIAYLECFFSLTDSNDNYIIKRSPAEVMSVIDRKNQIMSYKLRNNILRNEKVIFFYYQSKENDFAHYLNYRLSILNSNPANLEFNKEFFLNLSTIISIQNGELDTLLSCFINEISTRTFGKDLFDINEFNSFYKTYKNNLLIIPILLTHSEEININHKIISDLFHLFIKGISEIIDKKIVFIINFQDIDIMNINSIINVNNNTIVYNDLGILKPIEFEEVKTWIRENINSNPNVAQEYIEKYFISPFPKSMSSVLEELEKAEEILKTITNK